MTDCNQIVRQRHSLCGAVVDRNWNATLRRSVRPGYIEPFSPRGLEDKPLDNRVPEGMADTVADIRLMEGYNGLLKFISNFKAFYNFVYNMCICGWCPFEGWSIGDSVMMESAVTIMSPDAEALESHLKSCIYTWTTASVLEASQLAVLAGTGVVVISEIN